MANVNESVILSCLVLTVTAGACTTESGAPAMYPDYRDVTVPRNIAPLNFHYSGEGSEKACTIFSSGDAVIKEKGKEVCISPDDWASLLESSVGSNIHVNSSLMGEWDIHVSADTVDSYLTYRLIEPGYEVWHKVKIKERNITNFDERTISGWESTENSCMNCHIHKGDNTMFYLRGNKGGAILSRRKQVRKLALNRDGMVSGTVYGDLHPGGRWGVFSSNVIIPGFHTQNGRRLEVYDTASDLCVVDFDSNRILTQPQFTRPDRLETFPCFSAGGDAVYYCSADTVSLPAQIEKLKYSLVRTPFNPETGKMGPEKRIIWDGPAHNASVCHPKASPDGRWLVFTVADYGTFPIWHRECDLWLMNLATLENRPLDEINSPEFSDTYHSWSQNSRWMVFASKREDGQYGKPFLCHIAADGSFSKPFLIPQKDPYHYEKTLKSYNIPDLGPAPAAYDETGISTIRDNIRAEVFE